MQVTGKGRENRDGVGVTDLTLKDMTDGKVLALYEILKLGAVTVLEKEVADFIVRGMKQAGFDFPMLSR